MEWVAGGETKISIRRLCRLRVAPRGLGPRLRTFDGDGRGRWSNASAADEESESEEGAEETERSA